MNENFYEAGLRRALHTEIGSGRIRLLDDSSRFFEDLSNRYPACGSKIDWTRVPGSIEKNEVDEDRQAEQFVNFFDEAAARFNLAGEVIYVGDSATDFALTSTMDCIREIITELLSIPQHHYFIGPNCAWCMCLTMEGDMGFGFALRGESGQ